MPKHRSLDAGILSAALEGLELQKQQLEQQIAEVRRVLGGTTRKAAAVVEAKKPRRKMSAAARKHISAVQKKRWAEWRKKGKTAGAKAKG